MNWKSNKLSEISLIGDGAHASLKRTNSGIPYLTAKNITKSGIDYSNMDYISEETYNQYFKKASNALTQPKENDVLYSIIGSIGGVYVVRDEKIGISSSVAIFRSNDNIVLPKYLAYFLKSPLFESQIQAIKSGVAQSFMSLGKLGTVNISYPDDILYQKKLIKILSTYDNLIENNQKQIKLLEEAAQRLYKEWFVDLRFPGYENTKIIDGIPEGWSKGSLSNIALFKRGKTITKAQVEKGDIPVVAGGLKPAYYHNKANTVAPVITVSGSGANAGYTKLYNIDVFASDCSFADSKTTPNLFFVYCFLKSNKEMVNSLQKGAAQPHVYAKDINSINLLVPNTKLINKFCKLVAPYFEKIKILENQNKLTSQARDRLLPKLVNGELEV